MRTLLVGLVLALSSCGSDDSNGGGSEGSGATPPTAGTNTGGLGGGTPAGSGAMSNASSGGEPEMGGTTGAGGATVGAGSGGTASGAAAGSAPTSDAGLGGTASGGAPSSQPDAGRPFEADCSLDRSGSACNVGQSCQWAEGTCTTGHCDCVDGAWECYQQTACPCPAALETPCGSTCPPELEASSCLCKQGGGPNYTSCSCQAGSWQCG